jgi:cell wall-associated NlpC family hydrolase
VELLKKTARLTLAVAAVALLLAVAVSADSGLVQANGGLNFRTGPGMNHGILCVIPNGTVISVDGAEDGWIRAEYNGMSGFVSAQYIAIRKDSTDRSGVHIDRTANQSKGEEIVAFAKQYLGYRYKWGGSSPATGFDCSGFTSYVYSQFGYGLNRTAAGQTSNGVAVSRDELIPGDLVMFSNSSGSYGHVGIYVGDGNFIHSVQTGTPVSISSLTTGSYSRRLTAARRIVQ